MKPTLLLDVDGVLNAFGGRAPDHMVQATAHSRRPYTITYDPVWADWLVELGQVFDLAWCTTWLHDAPTQIAPLFKLPPLPVVEFDPHEPGRDPVTGQHRFYKLPGLLDWLAKNRPGTPWAMLDDDAWHYRDTVAWLATRGQRQALIRCPRPHLGLDRADVDAVMAWAANPSGVQVQSPYLPADR